MRGELRCLLPTGNSAHRPPAFLAHFGVKPFFSSGLLHQEKDDVGGHGGTGLLVQCSAVVDISIPT